jgi:hypothetical protein
MALTTQQYKEYRANIQKKYANDAERMDSALRSLNRDYKASPAYMAQKVQQQQDKALDFKRQQQGKIKDEQRVNSKIARDVSGIPTLEEFGGMDTMEKAATIGNAALNIGGVVSGVGLAGSLVRGGIRNLANYGVRKALKEGAKQFGRGLVRTAPVLAGGVAGSELAGTLAESAGLGEQTQKLARNLGAGVGGFAAGALANKIPGLKFRTPEQYIEPEVRTGPKWAQAVSDAADRAFVPGGKFAVKNPAAYRELRDADAYEGNIEQDIKRAAKRVGDAARKATKGDKTSNMSNNGVNRFMEGDASRIDPRIMDSQEFQDAAKAYRDLTMDYTAMDTDFSDQLTRIVRDPAFSNLKAKDRIQRARFLIKNANRLDEVGATDVEKIAIQPTLDVMKLSPEFKRLTLHALDNPNNPQRGRISSERVVKEYMNRNYGAFLKGENFVPDPAKKAAAITALEKKGMSRQDAISHINKLIGQTAEPEDITKLKARTLTDLDEATPELRDLLEPVEDFEFNANRGAHSLAKSLGDKRRMQGLVREKAVVGKGQIDAAELAGEDLNTLLRGAKPGSAKKWRDARAVNDSVQYDEMLSRALGNDPSLPGGVIPGGEIYTTPELLQLLGSPVAGSVKSPMAGAKNAAKTVGAYARPITDVARQVLVGMNPKGAIRNALSDSANMVASGMKLPSFLKNMGAARRTVNSVNAGDKLDELSAVAKASGVMGGGFSRNEMPAGMNSMTDEAMMGKNISERLAGRYSNFLKKIPGIGKLPDRVEKEEAIRRVALFRDELAKLGVDMKQGFRFDTEGGKKNIEALRGARERVNKVLFDYANPTAATRFVNAGIPLSSYTMESYRNMPELFMENPGRYMALMSMLTGGDIALEDSGLGLDPARMLMMPGAVTSAQEMGEGRSAASALPANIAGDFVGGSNINPVIAAYEFSKNSNSFGQKIMNPKDSMIKQASQGAAYLSQPFVPSTVQVLLDAVSKAAGGTADTRTVRAISGQTDKSGNTQVSPLNALLGYMGLPVVRDDIPLRETILNRDVKINRPNDLREQAVKAELIRRMKQRSVK